MIHHAHIPESIEETYLHREWFPVLRSLGIPDANIWQTAHAIERLGIQPAELRQSLASYLRDGMLPQIDRENPQEILDVFDTMRTQFIQSLHVCDRELTYSESHLPLIT